MEQNISAVEVYSLLKFCSKIKNKFYYISRNITINKCQVNRLIERIERFMQTLDEVLNNKPQLTFGTLNKIKQLKDLFLRIGGHLNSYLRYGYLRRLLHPLEQEREFIFYTDQLCSIAQFFGFYLIDGKQRLLEDEEDQLIDFAEFTQVLESVQGNDAKLLSFLGLDVDPSALPEVLNALENAIQMNGISSNKIVTIDLNNEHFLSNTRILTFINNQLTQINRYLINNGHNPPIEESKSSVPSPYVDTTYTKINYDYLKPITSVVVNDGKNLSQDSLAHSNNTNNSKSKNLTDFLGMNENNKSKHHSRSRSRSRKGTSSQPNQHIHHSHSHSHGRSLSLSFNLSKNHSHNHSHNRSRSRSHIDEEDSDFYTETDLQRQQRQMRKALTEVYSNGSINHSDNIDSIASPSPIKGRIISNKNTGNNPLQINTNIRVTTRKSSPIPFSMTRKVINSDDSPINLNILEFVDSDDSDEDERGRKRQTVGYIKNQGLITPAGSTPNTPKSAPLYFDSPYFTRREIQASKLENNCLIIDTQLQLKSVYYELVRISGGQVGFYVKQAWKIPFWDMELWDIIESTLISKIYRGLWHFTEVAVKEIDIPLETPELQQQFQSYVENWYSLRHPHIIPLLGASITHNIPYVVMPFLSKGNLVQYLENNLDIPHLISIILDISSGMQYLHSRQLIHGELMASNILIDNYGEPSICDLGFSKYFYFSSLSNNKSTNSTMEDGQSTLIRTNNSYINRKINRYIRWTANEIQDNYIYTFASDVYSFGMLCYEIFSGGDVPFSDIPENIIPEAVKSGRRPSRPSGCPDEIWSLMQKCWDINPDKRPTFYEISQNLMQIKTHYKIIYSNTEMILPNNTQVHSPSQSLNTSITMNNNNIPSWLAIPDYSYTNINLDSKSNHNSYLGLGQGLSQGQGQSEDQGQKQEQGQDQGFLHTMENQTQEQAYSHRRSNSVNYSKPSNVSNINMNLQINDNSISRNSNDLSISNSYSSGYSSPKNSINRSSFHENIKYPVISGINSQKISPYMKAALMNSSLLPNNINISSNNASDNNNDNNNNSSNNKSNNKNNDITLNNDNNNNNLNNLPIINLNLNNKNNGQFNYLQQLMNDEENSNINRFNESRVTNIPLSPSTTTDSDEINDSLNRYHSLTTKNEINIQTKKGGHLKSSLSLNNIPSLNSNTNRYHHSRTSKVRKGSLDSYQSSYSENENNSKTDLQKRNINSSCTKKVEVEDVEQYIKKHLITKDNIPVDLDLNNEQFIQQIEHLDMSNNFSNKRNSENQQSKVYIDKVLRKVSSIKKEYENPISSNNSSSTSFSYLKHSSFPSTFSDQGQGQGQEQGQEQRLGQGQEQDQGQDQKRNSVSSFKRNTIISNSSSSLDSPILLQGQQGSSLTTTTIQSSNTIHSTGNAKTPQIEALFQLTQQLKQTPLNSNVQPINIYMKKDGFSDLSTSTSTSTSRSVGTLSSSYPNNLSNENEVNIKSVMKHHRSKSQASTNTNTTTEVSQSNKTEEDSNQTTVGTSKIVGILKISNSNSNSASNAHVDIDNSNGNDGHSKSGPTESIMEKSNHLSSSVNTNSVRFALDDDYANKSLDEFDIKGMTSDNLDHIANLLMNEESDTKFETNQQILFHKKRLKELINELRYRIGDNQVDECIKEDTIEINTYSWSDLSFKRTSIRILIDIIKHTFAKSVILKDCRFSDLAAKCIAMAVKKNPFIKRLDITFCSKWARTQTDPITNILNYDSARYDSTWVLSKLVGPKSASAFANMLQVNTSLKVLQLRNASFGDTGVALIAKALQNNYVLEKLEIDNCCTAEYGSHAIAEALKVNTSLQVLNLSQNSLSDKGGIAIIEALQENHTLKALVLHRCTLSSSKFCDSFSKTLSINDSILEIDLGSNSFSKDGIKYIAEGLSHNQTLEVLKLEDCNLSKKCVSILSKALDNENNKTELHLGSVLKFWDKKELFNKRILFHKEQFA
ncbi:hypothetical protein H8356DRAFT_919933 [Neocallimastix lanati (nom. inval.)]|nr:hypothetical protein H8356DRAFT_919933 [Neocallimastix sp. JGI-2020a]